MLKTTIDRSNNFDFLRFLLAFSVVVYHLIALVGNKSLNNPVFTGLGKTPVYGFFIISGFLITSSVASGKGLKIYIENRVRRLVPAYVLVVMLSAIFLVFLSTYTYIEYYTDARFWKYLVSNLLFLNFLQPELPGVFKTNILQAVDGSLWTIKVEIAFYILLPILFAGLKKLKSLREVNWILIILYALTFFYRYLCDLAFEVTKIEYLQEFSHQMPGYFNYFGVGMLLYFNFDVVRKYQNKLLILATILILLNFVFKWEFLYAPGLGLVIFYIAFNLKFLNNFGKFGDFSYGIYIFHFPIFQVLISIGFITQEVSVNYLLSIMLVLLASISSWYLVEKQFLKKKH